jgi:hypothetical protein
VSRTGKRPCSAVQVLKWTYWVSSSFGSTRNSEKVASVAAHAAAANAPRPSPCGSRSIGRAAGRRLARARAHDAATSQRSQTGSQVPREAAAMAAAVSAATAFPSRSAIAQDGRRPWPTGRTGARSPRHRVTSHAHGASRSASASAAHTAGTPASVQIA